MNRIDGDSWPIQIGASGTVEFVDTDRAGNYRVESDGQLANLFAINLFDRGESEIAAAPSVEVGYEAVEAVAAETEERREYWRIALLAMLGLLAAEWWVYTKRVS